MNNSAPKPQRQLEVQNLALQRGDRTIFNNVSFSVQSGEVLQLRGPNGVGKTSLLMCLANYLRPLAGNIKWQGHDADTEPDAHMHFIGHQHALKPNLTVRENLDFWSRVNGGAPASIFDALTRAHIHHAADFDTAYLSAGQLKRLSLCRLLVAPRPVWLLDEPTAALDSAGDEWVGTMIDQHRQNGGLVIAATHLALALPQGNYFKTLTMGTAQ